MIVARTTTSEQPVNDDLHHHMVLPMSISEVDEVWKRLKRSLGNITVDVPQISSDQHCWYRLKKLLDLPETDQMLEWRVGYSRVF